MNSSQGMSTDDMLWEVRNLAQSFLIKHESVEQQQRMEIIRRNHQNIPTQRIASPYAEQLKRPRLGGALRVRDEPVIMPSEMMIKKSYYDEKCTTWQNLNQSLQRDLDKCAHEIRFLIEKIETEKKWSKDKIAAKDDEIKSLRNKLTETRARLPAPSNVSLSEKDTQNTHLWSENEMLKKDLSALKDSSALALVSLQRLHADEIKMLKSSLLDREQQLAAKSHIPVSRNTSVPQRSFTAPSPSFPTQVVAIDQNKLQCVQSRLDHTLTELAAAQTALGDLQLMREQAKAWDSIFSPQVLPRPVGENVTALKVFEALSQSRSEKIKLQSLLGSSEARCCKLHSKVKDLMSQLQEASTERQHAECEVEALRKEVSSLSVLVESNKTALQWRDNLLKSYEANESKVGQRVDCQVAAKEAQMANELAEKNKLLEQFSRQLKEQSKPVHCRRCSQFEDEVFNLKLTITEQVDQMEKMEAKSGSGFKVLHMTRNPSVDAARDRLTKEKARQEELEIENEDLRRRVTNIGGTPADAASGPDQKLVNERLKELFRKNVEQFKHAVQSLFGYELIFSPGAHAFQLKLRSIYAEREEDCLQFEWKDLKEGKVDMSAPLQLLSTPFALRLKREKPQMFDVYLRNYNSIPLFLGEVTTELFHSTTQFHQCQDNV